MEYLKSVFGEKAMTYDEFAAALAANKDIKLANLAGGEYVAKGKLEAAEAKVSGLQKQLEDANAAIKSFEGVDVDGIKQKAAEWEQKYTTETAALKKQLEDSAYAQTVKEASANLKFTSESARRAFISELTAKKLQTQDGKLLGFDDFVKSYKETDAAAFADENEQNAPMFTKPTNINASNTVSPGDALRAAFGLPTTQKE